METFSKNAFYNLGYLAHMASMALTTAFNKALEESPLNIRFTQCIALCALAEKDGISQFELARTLTKDAAGVKRAVDQLQAEGLIKREEVRHLKNALYITEKGRSYVPAIMEIANQVIQEAWGDFPVEQRQTVLDALLAIPKNLNNKKHG